MALQPSGSISLGDIQTEFSYASASLAEFYDISAISGGGGLMFHNVYGVINTTHSYGIGPSNNQDAAAIYTTYNAGADLRVSLWYNYYQIPELVYTVNIYHTGTPGIDPQAQLEVWICDENGAQWYNIFGGSLNPTDTFNFANYAASSTMVSSSYGGYTFQIANLVCVGPGNLTFTAVASDSDGLGPGQNRDVYAPATNPFNSGTGAQTFTCCDDTASSGNLIRINKRTTLTITISP